jgi:hypothetical protein
VAKGSMAQQSSAKFMVMDAEDADWLIEASARILHGMR